MRLLKPLVAVLAVVSGSAAVHAQAPDPNFHVFLALGQSNMEGFPGIPEEEKAFDDLRFQVLAAVDFPELGREAGEWSTAVPPLCRPNSGLSPADYFGRTLIANLPADQRVGIVSVAVAGAKIEVFDDSKVAAYEADSPDWRKRIIAAYDGSPYQRLVAMARQAQQTGVIRGILLHQGESNNGDTTWPAQVQALYGRLLADLGLEAADVPLLAGELVGADQDGACAAMNEIIATLPDVIPTARVISSAGCEARRDRLHFTPAGYRELGRRYGEAMLALLAAD